MPAGMNLSVRMWSPGMFHAAVAAEVAEVAVIAAEVAVVITIAAAAPVMEAEAIDIDICMKKRSAYMTV